MDSCPHPAGSVERIEAYRLRVELGLEVFNPDDARDIICEKSSEHLVIARRWKKSSGRASVRTFGRLELSETKLG